MRRHIFIFILILNIFYKVYPQFDSVAIIKISQRLESWRQEKYASGKYENENNCNVDYVSKENYEGPGIGLPSKFKVFYSYINSDNYLDALVTFTAINCNQGDNLFPKYENKLIVLSNNNSFDVDELTLISVEEKLTTFKNSACIYIDSVKEDIFYGVYYGYLESDPLCCPSIHNQIKVFYNDKTFEEYPECLAKIKDVDTIVFKNGVKSITEIIDSIEFKSIVQNKNILKNDIQNSIANNNYIKLNFRNGKNKTYISHIPDSKYKFIGSFQYADYFLLRNILYEGEEFLLVDMENGKETIVYSEPYFSKDNSYLAVFNSYCWGIGESGLKIYKLNSQKKIELFLECLFIEELKLPEIDMYHKVNYLNGIINSIKWKGDNELYFEKNTCIPCEKSKYGRIILKE